MNKEKKNDPPALILGHLRTFRAPKETLKFQLGIFEFQLYCVKSLSKSLRTYHR